jgi:hypothetical protein
MFRSRLPLLGLALTSVVACSEPSGPAKLADPAATTAKIQAVSSVFAVPTIAAFTAVGDLMDPSTGLAPAGALLRATQPEAPRPLASGYAGSAQRYRAFTGLNLSPSNTLGLIPQELKGKTFEWDTLPGHERHYVVTDRPGAPADGVRFILYAVNPLTHRPAEPLVEVGYVDLHDLSVDNTRSLRIVVAGVDGTPVYVDYTVAGTITPGQFTASANGFISNGESGDASKLLTFDLAATLTETSFTFTASLSLDHPATTITETTSATKSLGTVTLTIDLTLVDPSQKVQLTGTATVVDQEQPPADNAGTAGHDDDDGVVTVDFEVRVNDQLFATIKGTAPDIKILGADGQPLSEEELHALRELFRLPARVFNFFQDLLHPVRRCFHV